MSRDTNLRYEQPHRPCKLFQEYIKNLQVNEVQLDKGQDQKMLDRKGLHDEWLEHSNVKLKARALKNEKKQLGHEIKMVAKANLLMRKRALALRIDADQKMYADELARFGKSFHTERI
uniref:Uncharacterized protein n=1 Tax=Arion vulgaris TaxID=1028688 RepID=A0A0B6YY24_9EUPU